MNTLSVCIEELLVKFSKYLESKVPPKELTPKIQVDEIATKIATFYEKVRNLIDYHESHLLRKNVIERTLRRRIFLKDISGKQIAEPLIKEIIRSGHLPNNIMPEAKILDVQAIIDRLLALLEQLKHIESARQEVIAEWLIGLAVCEIEASLVSPAKEMMLAESMYGCIRSNLVVNGAAIQDAEKDALLFIGIQKSFLKVDLDLLHFRILNFLYPNWNSFRPDEADRVARALTSMRENVVRYLRHPLLPYFLKLATRYAVIFSIIGDLVFGGKDIMNDWEVETQTAYDARYKKEKSRLFRLAFLSVISFFFSKVLIAFAVEMPIDIYVLHEFSWVITVANVIFPPLLMLLIVLSVRLPSEHNFNLVLEEVRAALFEENKKNYIITVPKNKSFLVRVTVNLSYVLVFAVSLHYLTKLLLMFHFSPANIVIFVLFTSLVTATGVKIYNRAKEMSLEKEKARVGMFVLDLFTIPLVTIGRWVMSGLKRFNIFIIFINFFVELPFQIFVEFLENFNNFIKSKKEEIR